MDQLSTLFAGIIAAILGIFGMSSANVPTTPSPTPAAMISEAPESMQKVIYKGTSPCADCSGIDIVLTLNYNGADNVSGTYTQSNSYQGKPQGNYTDQGTWKGLQNDIIELMPEGGGQPQYYKQATIPTLVALGANKEELPPPYNYTLTAGQP